MPGKAELQLITDSRNGDREAMAELFRRHYPLSISLARADLTGARRVLGRRAIGLSFCLPEFQLISGRFELHGKGLSRFMFELLVPPEKEQLARLDGDTKAYDLNLRPGLMCAAIEQLQDAGVEPDIWKIEGLDRRKDCERVVAAARRNGREEVGCIILGRGEDDQKVKEWLYTASGVPGFIGFAVGRTSFWDALVDWRAKKITRGSGKQNCPPLSPVCGYVRGPRSCRVKSDAPSILVSH